VDRTSLIGETSLHACPAAFAIVSALSSSPHRRSSARIARTEVGATAPNTTLHCETVPSLCRPTLTAVLTIDIAIDSGIRTYQRIDYRVPALLLVKHLMLLH
jgi:hypothetical protein